MTVTALSAIFGAMFGGGGLWLVNLLRERREAKMAPLQQEEQRLQNRTLADDLARKVAEAQNSAVDRMRVLMQEAQAQADSARREAGEAKAEAKSVRAELEKVLTAFTLFRQRVEALLIAHEVPVPEWLHEEWGR